MSVQMKLVTVLVAVSSMGSFCFGSPIEERAEPQSDEQPECTFVSFDGVRTCAESCDEPRDCEQGEQCRNGYCVAEAMDMGVQLGRDAAGDLDSSSDDVRDAGGGCGVRRKR